MLVGILSDDDVDPEDNAQKKSDLIWYLQISQFSIDVLELALAKKVTSAFSYKWHYAFVCVLQNT